MSKGDLRGEGTALSHRLSAPCGEERAFTQAARTLWKELPSSERWAVQGSVAGLCCHRTWVGTSWPRDPSQGSHLLLKKEEEKVSDSC